MKHAQVILPHVIFQNDKRNLEVLTLNTENIPAFTLWE